MKADGKLSKLLKIVGLLYLVGHSIVFITVGILIFSARQNAPANPGYILILFPALGIFAGYCIWKGKYSWWRNIIIGVSLLILGVVLFIAFVAAPTMEKIHKEDAILETKLLQIDEDVQRMFLGVYTGDVNVVREQLDKGVDVEVRNEGGSTALHAAQNENVINLLIERGADVNALNPSRMTPMFNKEVKNVKILLAAGADINAKSYEGNTLFLWYTYSGYLEGLKFLAAQGVDVHACNEDNQSAVDLEEYLHHETTPNLLDHIL